MRRSAARLVDALRQPEYTGENRCLPCTAVNVVIAALLGVAVALIAAPLGLVVFVLSLGLIYLRGYLVPGTPTLTTRYLPDRVLQVFDTHPTNSPDPDGFDAERALKRAGAIEDCADADDLCLTSGFRATWHDRIRALRSEGVSRGDLTGADGLTEQTLMFEEHGEGVSATVLGGSFAGQWESEAALLADLAAIPILRDRYPDWDSLTVEERSHLLHGLRVFLDQCPRCDGPIAVGEATVESCCRSMSVLAASCDECGARLYERS